MDSIDSVRNSIMSGVSTPAMMMAMMGAGIGALAFAGLAVPAVGRFVLPNPEETRLSEFLPFERVEPDGVTIICRDGTMMQVIECRGLEDTFLSPTDREALFLARKDWVDALSDTGVTIRAVTIRELRDAMATTTHTNPVLREIASRWNGSFQEAFVNKQIIMLSLPGKTRNAQSKLNGATATTETVLHKYGPKKLSQHNADPQRRPLSILGRIISPITKPTPSGVGSGASEAMTAEQVEFGGDNGVIRFRSGDHELYCASIGFRSMGDFTYEELISSMNTVQGEIIISQIIEPWSKTKATFTLQQHYRLSLSQRFSPGTARQFEEALDRVEGSSEDSQSMSRYMMNVFVFGKTREEMKATEVAIKRAATNFGLQPVREGAIAQASWFCQFPGYKIWPRPMKLFSRNIATHVTMERPPIGLPRSDWGEGPIANFRTSSGTAYSFQFHISTDRAAVAHAVTIGPTGSGKTTLVNFLTGMAMRHDNLRCYMVDRHGGGYIFTHSVSGSYVTFEQNDMSSEISTLNPFQLADNPSNRSFLRAFLQALSGLEDPDTVEEIGFAIDAAYENPGLPTERRSLANIYDACFSKALPLRKELQKWVDPTVYGSIFNAERDTLDLTSKRLVTLDFTRIYEHDDLARAVILYLMHRIQSAISETRSPALIFIDETEPIVRHPMFRTYFMQMLQEYRKKGAAVISAFQRPEAITAAGLGETIRGQAQTSFFFMNPQAQEREYADWGLTDREWLYIKGKLPASKSMPRSVLMKRATGESVILNTDLSALGPLLKIYYSDEPSRALATRLMEEAGPEWLNIYLDTNT